MALTQADLATPLTNGIDPYNLGKYQFLLDDIQGNILKSHGRDHSAHLFLQFKVKADLIKSWIRDFAKQYVTSAQRQAEDSKAYKEAKQRGEQAPESPLFANFFLSMQGYLQLGFEYGQTPNDKFFRAGAKDPQTWAALGDPPPRNPIFSFIRNWDSGFADRIDALVLLAHDNPEILQQQVNQVRQSLRRVAKVLRQEAGFILRNEAGYPIEHFGFRDGLSQPLFMKDDIDRVRSGSNFDQWDPRSPLNLVLVKDPHGKTEDSYGSYLVYRKLEQNVQGFRQRIRQMASALKISVELAEAYTIGRFRDGTPVTLASEPDANQITNEFNYASDMQGSRCPFHAHIRKSNPRGDSGRIKPPDIPLEEEKSHRIVRRGISYGDKTPQADPQKGSGLLFMCFQADIEHQFLFIQVLWVNGVNFVKPQVGKDPLAGQGAAFPNGKNQHLWPKQWGDEEAGFEDFNFNYDTDKKPEPPSISQWVNMKGGENFFAPSISFLKDLE
ncbi:MAG: Dyp-type peroxidase [Pseudanabaenales cyanobacterium]|nr:Dyp-type peroxidase [Pseudanabaenales cyanobacterium]